MQLMQGRSGKESRVQPRGWKMRTWNGNDVNAAQKKRARGLFFEVAGVRLFRPFSAVSNFRKNALFWLI